MAEPASDDDRARGKIWTSSRQSLGRMASSASPPEAPDATDGRIRVASTQLLSSLVSGASGGHENESFEGRLEKHSRERKRSLFSRSNWKYRTFKLNGQKLSYWDGTTLKGEVDTSGAEVRKKRNRKPTDVILPLS